MPWRYRPGKRKGDRISAGRQGLDGAPADLSIHSELATNVEEAKELRRARGFVRAAVAQDGRALRYVAAELQPSPALQWISSTNVKLHCAKLRLALAKSAFPTPLSSGGTLSALPRELQELIGRCISLDLLSYIVALKYGYWLGESSSCKKRKWSQLISNEHPFGCRSDDDDDDDDDDLDVDSELYGSSDSDDDDDDDDDNLDVDFDELFGTSDSDDGDDSGGCSGGCSSTPAWRSTEYHLKNTKHTLTVCLSRLSYLSYL